MIFAHPQGGYLHTSIIDQCRAAKSEAFDDVVCMRNDWSVIAQRAATESLLLCS